MELGRALWTCDYASTGLYQNLTARLNWQGEQARLLVVVVKPHDLGRASTAAFALEKWNMFLRRNRDKLLEIRAS